MRRSSRSLDTAFRSAIPPTTTRAAARALLEGANLGNTMSAEKATGYRWGEPALIEHVEALMSEAEQAGDERTVRLAGRFLRKAGASG